MSQENAGQAAAINHGNAVARGEILGYLSDDDVLLPGASRASRPSSTADPAAAAAYPGYREIDAEGRIEDTVGRSPYSPRAALRLHDTVIGPGGLARRGGARARRRLGSRAALDGRPDHVDGRRARRSRDPGRRSRSPAGAAIRARRRSSPRREHAREHLRVVEIGAAASTAWGR